MHRRTLPPLAAAIAVTLAALPACTGAEAPAERSGATAARPGATVIEAGTTPGSGPGGAPTNGTDAPLPTPPASGATSTIAWRPCDGLECGTLVVPLDRSQPDGEHLRLNVYRAVGRAADGQHGPVLVNPGGPGGSVRSTVIRIAGALGPTFSVYGLDPRGVSGSHALTCDPEAERAFRHADSAPDSTIERRDLEAKARAVADACARTSGPLLPHMRTDDVVDDLDDLRVAIGADRINWFGLSYGTLLGLRYAERHPTRLRAMVLDGVVDPALTLEELLRDQAIALRAAVDRAATACRGTPRCPVDPAARLASLRQRVEVRPIDVRGRPFGPAELTLATVMAGYAPSLMDALLAALVEPDDLRAASALLRLADQYSGTGSFGTYLGVECTDGPRPTDEEGFRAMAVRLEATAPGFGAAVANELLPCARWAAPAGPPPQPVAARGAPTTLVVGTTGDPATPYSYSQTVASTLESAVLVTYRGEGHTAFGSSDCVREIEVTYLRTATPPPAGTTCPAP